MVRFRAIKRFKYQDDKYVSIPVWFDLEPAVAYNVKVLCDGFNSCMVRFRVNAHNLKINQVKSFNSCMVRFRGKNFFLCVM